MVPESIDKIISEFQVDLLCGGFPCQPVSFAGHRLAQDDARWLWPEFLRCIRLLRPRYVLIENVPGLFSAGFTDVLSGLSASGYDAEWSVISACAFGAPHTRERVWILAYPKGIRCEGNEIFSPNCESFRERVYAQSIRSGGLQKWQGWALEPGVCRVADGIPSRTHRLRAIGNAVVPQIVEAIGKMILEVERENMHRM